MLKINLDTLTKALNEVSTVASSVTQQEKQRNVLVLGKEGKVYLFAKTSSSQIRYELPSESFELTDEEFFVQVRVKELQALLITLNPSTTENVIFEVTEFALNFKAEITTLYGNVQPLEVKLDLIPIPSTAKDQVLNLPIAENEIDTEILSYYLDYLLPNLDSVEQTTDSSKLIFGEEAVFTLSGSSFTYMVSQIPEEFSETIISKASLLLMQSIFNENPTVKILRDNDTNSLVLQTDNIVSVCNFNRLSDASTLKKYPVYIEQTKVNNYLAFDRSEFDGVLKRLSIFDEPVKIRVADLEEDSQYSLKVDKEYFPDSYLEEHHPYLLEELEDDNDWGEEVESETESEDEDWGEENIEEDSYEDEQEEDLSLDFELDFEEEENPKEDLTLEDLTDMDTLVVEEKQDSITDFIAENSEIDETSIEEGEVKRVEDPNNVPVTVSKELIIENSKFSQSIPILYFSGDVPKQIKIIIKRVEFIQKAILGGTNTASEVLLLGVKQEQQSYGLTFYDSYELWFSFFAGEK